MHPFCDWSLVPGRERGDPYIRWLHNQGESLAGPWRKRRDKRRAIGQLERHEERDQRLGSFSRLAPPLSGFDALAPRGISPMITPEKETAVTRPARASVPTYLLKESYPVAAGYQRRDENSRHVISNMHDNVKI